MNTATNGHAPQVDEQTQQQIDDVLKGAKKSSEPAEEKPKKPKAAKNESAIAPASEQVSGKLANQAQALVEADKQAKKARIQAGVREGLEQAKDIREGRQYGVLAGLTQATIEDTRGIIEQLKVLSQHSDATNDLSDVFSLVEGEKDPLEELKVAAIDLVPSLPSSRQAFKIFE